MGESRGREHEFTLALSGIDGITPEMADALHEAGCDDATIARRQGGVFMTFDREAPTLDAAVRSAIDDVRRANIGAQASLCP